LTDQRGRDTERDTGERDNAKNLMNYGDELIDSREEERRESE
jgi:hypothetical protein